MLEMIVLLQHRSFIEVIVRGQPVLAGVLRQHANIFHVIAADIHVEEDHRTIYILLPDQILEVLASRYQGFGKPWFLVPGIQSEIEYRCTRVAEAVGNFRTQQASVCADIYPESLLRRVVDNFMRDLRPK